jgi:hypothetical protein
MIRMRRFKMSGIVRRSHCAATLIESRRLPALLASEVRQAQAGVRF